MDEGLESMWKEGRRPEFPQYFQANTGKLPQVRQQRLPFTYYSAHDHAACSSSG